jgi:hypothetical protein
MTALWALVIVALIGMIGCCVLVAATVFYTVPSAFRAYDRQSARHATQMGQLLDRLMTIKWEDYVAARDSGDDFGGFLAPGEQAQVGDDVEEVTLQEPGRWGHLSALRDRAEAEANEEALLYEDFPTGEAR